MKRMLMLATMALLFSGCGTGKITGSHEFEQLPQVIAANEMAAMTRLRTIVTAEIALQFEGDGSYATLDQLIDRGMLVKPAEGKRTGYRIEVKVKPGGFEATAVPEKFAVTGKRSFYVDESRIMRAADKGGLPASAADPELQ